MEIRAQDVINALFNPEDTVNLRIINDKKDSSFGAVKHAVAAGKFSASEGLLREHNKLGHAISLVVNFGGDTDAEITRINAQFVEMDDGTFEEQQAKIDAFPLKPSMIIRTKRSLHTYWFINDGDVRKFRPIQKALVKQFDGDPMCVNESRAMRLPGFYHCKQEPIMVTCISFHPELRYTQEQLEKHLPELDEKFFLPPLSGDNPGLKVVMNSCDFMRYCKDNAENLPEPYWYAMITNLADFVGGSNAIHELSKPYPGYDYNKTQQKINHYFESKTKPITCRKIAEAGFVCPKLGTGECLCKAPAGLAYQPLNIEGLRDCLYDVKVTGDVLKDMLTAKEFIETYLYNQDNVTAESMINYELKAKFKLKAPDVKPLLTFYRDCAKDYQRKSKHKLEFSDSTAPDWYEVSTKGLIFHPGTLAEHLAKSENLVYAAQQYYAYHEGVYSPISELDVQHIIQEKMIASETKANQISDAEHQLRLLVLKNLREVNPNPYVINIKNGLYNVLEDKLDRHTPEYISTVQLGANYSPEAECPIFQQFLYDVMEGDEGQVRLIQEMMGYLLIPVQRAQKSFVIVGVAGAGKSVLLRVLNEILLGRQNVSNVTWQALNERFKTAELFGKLANIFADLPTKTIDDNGIFKALVGEDYLTVEKKNKDPFSFQSSARLVFSCNNIPKNYSDKSEGFYRRLIIIRFNKPVPAEKRDPELVSKFSKEADGIFMFALEGLKRLIKNNFAFSETQKNLDELQQYKVESDSVLSFASDSCIIDESKSVRSAELFDAYRKYCDAQGLKPYAHNTFIKNLKAAYPGVSSGVDNLGKSRTLEGICISEYADYS